MLVAVVLDAVGVAAAVIAALGAAVSALRAAAIIK